MQMRLPRLRAKFANRADALSGVLFAITKAAGDDPMNGLSGVGMAGEGFFRHALLNLEALRKGALFLGNRFVNIRCHGQA